MPSTTRFLLPILIVFGILNTFIYLLQSTLQKYDVDQAVLLAANALFLATGTIVFLMQKNAFKDTNPNVFVRSVISGMMIKMFVCAIAVVGYVVIIGKDYNKKSVFISLFFYLIYLSAEVAMLMRLNKKKHG